LVTGLGAAVLVVGAHCTDEPTNAGVLPKTQILVDEIAAGLDTPVDATPDATGQTLYFLATSGAQKGLFQVPASGGSVSTVHLGDPFVDPRGVAAGSEGDTLYVADPGADGGGVVYRVGDAVEEVAGSRGTHPVALDVVAEGDLYIAGQDTAGAPAILKLPQAGGTATVVASGAPLVEPAGLAVAANGNVLVGDRKGGAGGAGQAFLIASGKVTAVGDTFAPGSPLGTALTLDEGTLLLSSLKEGAGTSEVTIVNLAEGTTATFDEVIRQNSVSGGLHRAHFKDVYAWAGYTSVYRVRIVVTNDSSTPGGPCN
jgi:hypothetical protein